MNSQIRAIIKTKLLWMISDSRILRLHNSCYQKSLSLETQSVVLTKELNRSRSLKVRRSNTKMRIKTTDSNSTRLVLSIHQKMAVFTTFGRIWPQEASKAVYLTSALTHMLTGKTQRRNNSASPPQLTSKYLNNRSLTLAQASFILFPSSIAPLTKLRWIMALLSSPWRNSFLAKTWKWCVVSSNCLFSRV